MKTRCPDCQTVFRITPEQLKARAGKVRCGHCRTPFNALDNLLKASPPRGEGVAVRASDVGRVAAVAKSTENGSAPAISSPAPPRASAPAVKAIESASSDATLSSLTPEKDAKELAAASQNLAAPSPADGLILPRDTTEIPGYSKWSNGVMTAPAEISSDEPPPRWPFKLVTAGLALILAGQVIFHFRGELAANTPALRPTLEAFSQILGQTLPLPKHIDSVSIEASDLQIDPARGKLLVLNATLRNKASYEQAYPSLELALTDMQDSIIARRLFGPADYLPAKTGDSAFQSNTDVPVRLWIETVDLDAAGYRLFVYYP